MQRGQYCLQNRLARTGSIGLISNRVLGATPGQPPASHHLSHTPPPIPKGRRGFCLLTRQAPNGCSCRTRQLDHPACRTEECHSLCVCPDTLGVACDRVVIFFGITDPARCSALRCWNLSSSSAAGTFAGKCAIRTEKWLRAEGRKPGRPPAITPIARCSWCFPPAGKRPISNRIKRERLPLWAARR